MLAVAFHGTLELVTRPTPVPGQGEALVQVLRAGICNTDLEIVRGYMGFSGVLGHEFVGRVVSSPLAAQVGCRVVGEINLGCGECAHCRRGLGRHCPRRSVLGILGKDGALAEFVTLPVGNLHLVPDEVPDDEAVFVEPLAAALEIAEQVRLEPGARALVLGAGKLGLLVAQVLAVRDLEVTVLCRREARRAMLQSWGVRVGADPEALGGDFDLVVEATGSPEGFALAVKKTSPRGTVVLKSTYAGRAALDLTPLVVNEITVVGSRCGRFPPALEALRRRRVRVGPMVEGTWPLSEALPAFARAAAPGALKVLLAPVAGGGARDGLGGVR